MLNNEDVVMLPEIVINVPMCSEPASLTVLTSVRIREHDTDSRARELIETHPKKGQVMVLSYDLKLFVKPYLFHIPVM